MWGFSYTVRLEIKMAELWRFICFQICYADSMKY